MDGCSALGQAELTIPDHAKILTARKNKNETNQQELPSVFWFCLRSCELTVDDGLAELCREQDDQSVRHSCIY